MTKSKLMNTLVEGLRRAHKAEGPGAVLRISKQAGLHPSTVAKVRSGETKRLQAPNLERLWCALADEGFLNRSFVFPVTKSVASKDQKEVA